MLGDLTIASVSWEPLLSPHRLGDKIWTLECEVQSPSCVAPPAALPQGSGSHPTCTGPSISASQRASPLAGLALDKVFSSQQ